MRAERAVDATALYTHDDAQIDAHPLDAGIGAAIGAPGVPGVGVADRLQEAARALFAGAATRDGRPVADGGVARDVFGRQVRGRGGEGTVAVVVERGAFAEEVARDAARGFAGRGVVRVRRWEGVAAAAAFEGGLQRVVDGLDPGFHVVFGGGLVDAREVWRDDFEAEAALGVAGFADRGHPQVDGVHVRFEVLLPVDVLTKFTLVEHNPEPRMHVSQSSQRLIGSSLLVPGLLIQAFRIDVASRPTERPQKPFFPVLYMIGL